jgi:hypothetical protein
MKMKQKLEKTLVSQNRTSSIGSCLADMALAMAGMLVPLRATRSESVFSKILFYLHILSLYKVEFRNSLYIKKQRRYERQDLGL